MKLGDLATALVRFGRERRAREADARLLAEASVGGRLLVIEEQVARINEVLRAETWDWEEGA